MQISLRASCCGQGAWAGDEILQLKLIMSHFKNWTMTDADTHNQRVAGHRVNPPSFAPDCAPGTSARPKTRRLEIGKNGIQDQIETWLKSLGTRAAWTRSRTDVPSTNTVGTPDFIGGICDDEKVTLPFAIEVKQPGRKPTQEQMNQLRRWELVGFRTAVVHSLDEFKEVLKL